jgi:hypothetical protein
VVAPAGEAAQVARAGLGPRAVRRESTVQAAEQVPAEARDRAGQALARVAVETLELARWMAAAVPLEPREAAARAVLLMQDAAEPAARAVILTQDAAEPAARAVILTQDAAEPRGQRPEPVAAMPAPMARTVGQGDHRVATVVRPRAPVAVPPRPRRATLIQSALVEPTELTFFVLQTTTTRTVPID